MMIYDTDYVILTPRGKPTEARFTSESVSLDKHIQNWTSQNIIHIGPVVHGKSKFLR